MLLELDTRARRILRRLPQLSIYSVLELALIALLAIQCARLLWVAVTPLGPLGDWRAANSGFGSTVDTTILGQFDPFFRQQGGQPIVVTDLDIQLFGIRQDRASGRGAAIIATQSGDQNSYMVGDEIMPGVVLQAVGFDYITIERNGVEEQVFLSQSGASAQNASAVPARPTQASATPTPTDSGVDTTLARQPNTPTSERQNAAATRSISAANLARGTQVSPRREGDRLTGLILYPRDNGEAMQRAGFQPGDIIVSIDGERIEDMSQAATFATRMNSGNAQVQVERNGETISIRPRVNQ